MNVLEKLCAPFLEALCDNEAFEICVPKNTVNDIVDIIENEMDEDNNYLRNSKLVRHLTDVDNCKAYAQIMAVAALVLELKSGHHLQLFDIHCSISLSSTSIYSDRRTVSLRDVYYALKGLFKNQKECNAIILEVGRILHLKRRKHSLN